MVALLNAGQGGEVELINEVRISADVESSSMCQLTPIDMHSILKHNWTTSPAATSSSRRLDQDSDRQDLKSSSSVALPVPSPKQLSADGAAKHQPTARTPKTFDDKLVEWLNSRGQKSNYSWRGMVGSRLSEHRFIYIKEIDQDLVPYKSNAFTRTQTNKLMMNTVEELCKTLNDTNTFLDCPPLPPLPLRFTFEQRAFPEEVQIENKCPTLIFQGHFLNEERESGQTMDDSAIILDDICSIVSAFANTNGGHVFYGVEDKTLKVSGVMIANASEFEQQLERKISSMLWFSSSAVGMKKMQQHEISIYWRLRFIDINGSQNFGKRVVVVTVSRPRGALVCTEPPQIPVLNVKETTVENMDPATWLKYLFELTRKKYNQADEQQEHASSRTVIFQGGSHFHGGTHNHLHGGTHFHGGSHNHGGGSITHNEGPSALQHIHGGRNNVVGAICGSQLPNVTNASLTQSSNRYENASPIVFPVNGRKVGDLKDAELRQLVRHIPAEVVHDLGMHLGFSHAELSHIFLDNRLTHEAIFKILVSWRQANTGTAKRADILKTALENCSLTVVEDNSANALPAATQAETAAIDDLSLGLHQQLCLNLPGENCEGVTSSRETEMAESLCTSIMAGDIFDERFLRELAREIATDWKNLGSYLDFKTTKVQQFEYDSRTTVDAAYDMLRSWTRRCSSKQNFEQDLKEALAKCGRNDLIQKVQEHCMKLRC